MEVNALLEKIALPDHLVNVLQFEFLGNTVFQYGIFALIFVLAWFVALMSSFTFRRTLKRFEERIGKEHTERIVKGFRLPLRVIVFTLLVGFGASVLTQAATEENIHAHWVWWGVSHLFSVGLRLSLFWLLARVLNISWNHYLLPLIEKAVKGDEKRFFPVIYRLIITVLWITAIVYCIPIFGYDAVTLVKTILSAEALHNTIGQYLAFIGLALLTMLLGRTIFTQFQRLVDYLSEKSEKKIEASWFEGFEKPLLYLIILIGFRMSAGLLTEKVGGEDALIHMVISTVVNVLLATDITWIFFTLTDKIFENFIIPLVSSKSGFDQQLVPLMRKGVKASIGVVGFIFVIKAFGKDPASVLAGLGIGGVAIGFAAKDTLSPFISGIAIYLTRPYGIGDYIVVDGAFEGTVEDIGLRATILRCKQGTSYIIPNDKIINTPIRNMMSKDGKNGAFDGLFMRIDIATTPDKRDEAIEIFKQAVIDAKGASNPGVYFLEYGNDNIGFFMTYWVTETDRFWDIRHEVMMDIDNKLREKVIHMSTPTAALSFSNYLVEEWPTVNLGLPEQFLQNLKPGIKAVPVEQHDSRKSPAKNGGENEPS